MTLSEKVHELLLPEGTREVLERLPPVTGEFERDPWGYDKTKNQVAFALLKRLYDDYFRVSTIGIENVPTGGRVLLVANHSGQLPTDGVMIAMAMATNPHGPRPARAMIERFLPTVPFVGSLLNQMGAVVGDPHNCERMLENEEAIIVFPEGVRGSGKPYSKRYQLQRFGKGFMHLAIKHRTPIVPIGVVGCEETMPSLANIAPLARLLGLPYFPLALPVPMPARVTLNFGAPLRFEEDVTSEPEIQACVDAVKDSIRQLIREGLDARESVF